MQLIVKKKRFIGFFNIFFYKDSIYVKTFSTETLNNNDLTISKK